MFNAALSRAPEKLPDADVEQTEDSDIWMSVDADDFDEVLERAMRAGGAASETQAMETDGEGGEEARVAKEQTDKLRDLAVKVERFVEGKGDVEGAQFEEYACLFLHSNVLSNIFCPLMSVARHPLTKMVQIATMETYLVTRGFPTRMTKSLTQKWQSKLAAK